MLGINKLILIAALQLVKEIVIVKTYSSLSVVCFLCSYPKVFSDEFYFRAFGEHEYSRRVEYEFLLQIDGVNNISTGEDDQKKLVMVFAATNSLGTLTRHTKILNRV